MSTAIETRGLRYAASRDFAIEDPTLKVPLSVHPIGDWFLSDIIRMEGRQRFGRFWRSDRPFEAAFAEAFGGDLGAWTREWGVRQRSGGWQAHFTSAKPVTLGVTLAPSWVVLALGWSAAALLLAAWTARRRQVT